MSALFFTNEVIIYETLKLLKSNEISLHPCLFINRYWCRLTVPFLWKNPFQNSKSDSFMKTYVSCLSEPLLSDEERSILCSKELLIDSPLFEYERYLKEISFKSLNKAVSNWFDCAYGSKDERKKDFTQKLELYLFKMFAKQSNYLESIAIELEVEGCWNIFDGERSKISNIKNLSLSFPSMKENDFLTKVKKFLVDLKSIFQHLDEVCFFVDETSENNELISNSYDVIIPFIQFQKKLKGFNLIGGEDKFLNARRIISSALESHADTLVYLNIDNVSFDGMNFNYFERCYKLESLGLGYCRGLFLRDMDSDTKFRNLKKLELSLSKFSHQVTALILKKAGENLNELVIDDVTPKDITDALVKYCNKIENLTISGKNRLELPWLSKLKNLKILEFIHIIDSYNEFNESEISEIENSSSNIKIKRIITKLFTPEEFDCFYESTQHIDLSLVSVIFSPEVKDFESVSYEYAKSSLEINVSSSGGPYPSDDMDYKHITLKKKRSDISLNFHDLIENLSEARNCII